jgi:kynurenine formamidase
MGRRGEDRVKKADRITTCFACILGGLAAIFNLEAHGQNAGAVRADTAELRALYEQWREEFRTWGRWGQGDNKGASNLITPEKVRSATALVQNGITVSLAPPVPQVAAADVPESGLFYRTTNRITDRNTADTYQVSYHGLTVAHMDTWCHFFENGQMYNGIPVQGNLSSEEGCRQGSVMNWKDGVTTRAVLYDIAQLKGVDWVEPGEPITREDLEAWEEMSGVRAGPGDVVLLYTGRWKRRVEVGPWRDLVAGYYADTIPWMYERMPAFLGHDFNIDWSPRPGWEGVGNPIHNAALIWMGIGIVECLDLEQAVTTARELDRYEFLITFAPLPVEGGSGSPVNPLAVF